MARAPLKHFPQEPAATTSEDEFGDFPDFATGAGAGAGKAPESDDEFGLSSADEADLLQAEKSNPLKRKSDVDLRSVTKHTRTETHPGPTLFTARKVLKENFKLDSFRLKQEPAIDRLLHGESAVVVFPTGGGKSLCYQVPALCFKELDRQANVRQGPADSGITLVVSPLIALMKDQTDALQKRGIRAAAMDSTKSREQYLEIVDSMRNGSLDILYCAPERLNNEGFVSSMAHVKGGVRLLAVDEAHCISEWGHAFRPDYLKVARFAKEIQAERVICLTATATPAVASDVLNAFSIPMQGLFRTTTYRANLNLLARSLPSKTEAFLDLQRSLRSYPGPTIIYVTTQKQSEDLAQKLRLHTFEARHFHAGVDKWEKAACQEAFMASQSLIIVATIAFGMGIDKPDIRNVIHYDAPRSLEGYSQEIGRAGRDGQQSRCALYLCPDDLHLRESFARGDLPSKMSVAELLCQIFATIPVTTSSGDVLEANLNQQARDFDIKANVLNGIYAQLELRFGLLRATTPKYTSYSYVVLKNTGRDTSAAAAAIRQHSRSAKKWTTVDVDAAAHTSGLNRGDLVEKLNAWNEDGSIELKTGGVVHVYRVLKPFPATRPEKCRILDALYDALEAREQQDLVRMQAVLDLITGSACIARTLSQHFGDDLPNGQSECGHCTWCETHVAVSPVARPKCHLDQTRFIKVLKACPARDDPRFLARVAFGIGSPRVTKEKLASNVVFGSMEDHDFETLLDAFTRECGPQKTTLQLIT